MDKHEQQLIERILLCEAKVLDALYGTGTRLCYWERELYNAQKEQENYTDQLETEC